MALPASPSGAKAPFVALIAILALLMVGALFFFASDRSGGNTPPTDNAPAQGGADVSRNLAAFQVQDADGRVGSVVPPGGGVILLISDKCSHCHALLRQWGDLSQGLALPSLYLLTVEGAAPGRVVSEGLGVSAGGYVGPAGSIEELAAALDATGTPTLIRVDAEGNELERAVGELSLTESEKWLAWARLDPNDAP